jgi:hypothetical protein
MDIQEILNKIDDCKKSIDECPTLSPILPKKHESYCKVDLTYSSNAL